MKAEFQIGLLIAAAAVALPASAEEPGPARGEQIIVVTGRSIEDTRRALAECLARKCPPDEDIDATLAHAENLFVAGDYKAARRTTLASLGRNRRHARAYPEPVADLHRANGRIAAHLGEGRSYEFSTNAIRRSLKAGLGGDDIRLVVADLEKAGMYASLGQGDRAHRLYGRAEREARRLGRDDIAAHARLRAAWLHRLEGFPDTARAELEKIAADRTPAARVTRAAALVLLARLDRQQGRPIAAEALASELREVGGDRPVLLFSPPVRLPTNAAGDHWIGSGLERMAMQRFEKQWVDVGFRIGPSGRVSDVEMIRSQGSKAWAEPVLEAIAARIYTPASRSDGEYRVERYSLTSLWDYDSPGSRMRQRSSQARIEMLDLTVDPDPEPQSR
ncbi:MAG TPA: hypothetical protein VEW26_08990 [Allosphingosinicella sp.]|nr:hypothetical protein [Allosphingosinicella sp.]